MMPLEKAIMEYFGRSNEEALEWIGMIKDEQEELHPMLPGSDEDDPNHPGPQDGTGVNPKKKGSKTGLKNFGSSTNRSGDDA